ncbi:MAG TPA: DUF1634 domain-containing protein [Gemmatimonadales bacterium]|nr:DUF1634 domain-containing protein [Gemmatimonadales bacterium]
MASPERSEPHRPSAEEDERIELALAVLLRGGVFTAALLVVFGGLLHLIQHGGQHPDYGHFAGEPGDLQHPLRLLPLALQGSPEAIIQLGVVVLLATPVLRVAFSLFAFARERDRTYVVLTAVVLGVLLLSLMGVLP